MKVQKSVVLEVVPRYRIDGFRLGVLRARAGIGVGAFSKRAGWVSSRQYALEHKDMTVGADIAERLLVALRSFGIETDDVL